jgi:cell division protein FtsA
MPDQNNPEQLSIIGYGSSSNTGMRKGNVVYAEEVAESIIRAVTEAERIAGVQIQSATVNINGSHIESMNSRGVIAISAANREITEEDRWRVEEAATIVQMPPNREIVQVFTKNYRLDGQENLKDPVGMHGVRLEAETHIVTASTPALKNLDAALDKAQVSPNHHTLSSLAAAEAVLTRQQKEAGTILLDIGAGTTNIVVIEDGEIQHVAVLPIGGIHITNDLAIGLKTDLDIAEKVKIEHAQIASEDKIKKEKVKIEYNKKSLTFPFDDIVMITEARVDELLDYVEKELHRIQRARKLPGGVVLTGGTSKLPGIAEFTRDKLQLPSRVGHLRAIGGLTEKASDPGAFTAVGLMVLDMLLLPVSRGADGDGRTNTKILKSVSKFLPRFRK